jgi:hypothetical protein
MIPRQIGIISQSTNLSNSELAAGASALGRQVARDLARHWQVSATISSFVKLEDLPVGCWPIIVIDSKNKSNMEGYHTDEHGQPFAIVQYSPTWTLAASHEMIEMLIDPYGKTLVPGHSVDPAHPGRVEYLIEACDPCQDQSNAYPMNGFLVSDFYTPRYFDPQAANGVLYSANGKISKPREILSNGYITWHNLEDENWYQATLFGEFQIRSLGKLNARGRSLREIVDRISRQKAPRKGAQGDELLRKARQLAIQCKRASRDRAERLRAIIDEL